MNRTQKPFTGKDLAIVIPTKDRPEKVHNVLKSLANQSVSCRRIILVDGGQSVKDIVLAFGDRLPVEYCQCNPPGQIRQRNMGISLLNYQTPLIGFLDDDIVLEPQAIEAMITFWNKCADNTAGVSFNIISGRIYRHSWIRWIFGMSAPQKGRVLRSGYNVANSPDNIDLETQWLCGGATVWRKEVLKEFPCKEVYADWAICEDLIFSYPIGKEYPLFVCANAKVRHEHVYDHKSKMKYQYYGRNSTLWRFYFVESHSELSRLFFLWMILWQIIARSLLGIISFQKSHIQYALGQIEGVWVGITTVLRGESLLSVLNENTGNH